jgi:ferredoxin--NADP+ reductase
MRTFRDASPVRSYHIRMAPPHSDASTHAGPGGSAARSGPSGEATPSPAAAARPAAPPRPQEATCAVLAVRRIAPNLVVLRVARPDGLDFEPGHYGRLGLRLADASQTTWRAYSFVSAPGEAELEFLVTVIPGGVLSEPLAALSPGDTVQVDPAARGFFVERELAEGDTLWMLATGSGLGPYISMLRDRGVLRRWQRLVLVHSVRTAAELAYADEIRTFEAEPGSPLRYVPVVTREPGAAALGERIPTLIERGTLQTEADARLDPAGSRVMVCGNPEFTGEMRKLLAARGFTPCRRAARGSMLFEHYW